MDNFNQTQKQSFFDTINLSGEALLKENARAMAQEDLIEAIFKNNPTQPINPTKIWEIFEKKYHLHVPITSIRRAITNLATDSEKLGLVSCLLKTPVKVKGQYHLTEHCWIWKQGNEHKGIEKMPVGTTLAEYAAKMQPVQTKLEL